MGVGEREQMLKDSLRVFMGGFADQDELEGSKTIAFLRFRHPEIPSMRARLPSSAPE
jgi:hypothetical protein